MQLYADLPPRRLRQRLSDLCALVWIVGAIWFGKQAYDLVRGLGMPSEALSSAGADMATNLRGASQRVERVPIAGDALAVPLNAAADAANRLASAGGAAQSGVQMLAFMLGLSLAAGPVFFALLVWGVPRWMWIQKATAARRILDDPDGADLLALRALATRPLRQLALVGTDGVVDRWRRGDESTIRELASLELVDLGLTPNSLAQEDRLRS
jgi:hypothetical protein